MYRNESLTNIKILKPIVMWLHKTYIFLYIQGVDYD